MKQLMIALLFSSAILIGCEDDDYSSSDLIGSWQLTSVAYEDTTITYEEDDEYHYITFNSNGTYTSSGIFEFYSGNYSVDGNKLIIRIPLDIGDYTETHQINSIVKNKMELKIHNRTYKFIKD